MLLNNLEQAGKQETGGNIVNITAVVVNIQKKGAHEMTNIANKNKISFCKYCSAYMLFLSGRVLKMHTQRPDRAVNKVLNRKLEVY